MAEQGGLYGLLAEFDTAEALVDAAHRVRQAGYRRVDAYTPFPIEEVSEALDFRETPVPLIVLIGGIVGGVGGYFMQFWMAAVSYPINVGGRPFNSWQAFVPITFEMTVLFAALFALVGMLALNGLPRPYHPVFNVPSFVRATRDRFFLCIQARDARFDPDATRSFLEGLRPLEVADVPA